jgi:hypothetical protein
VFCRFGQGADIRVDGILLYLLHFNATSLQPQLDPFISFPGL